MSITLHIPLSKGYSAIKRPDSCAVVGVSLLYEMGQETAHKVKELGCANLLGVRLFTLLLDMKGDKFKAPDDLKLEVVGDNVDVWRREYMKDGATISYWCAQYFNGQIELINLGSLGCERLKNNKVHITKHSLNEDSVSYVEQQLGQIVDSNYNLAPKSDISYIYPSTYSDIFVHGSIAAKQSKEATEFGFLIPKSKADKY